MRVRHGTGAGEYSFYAFRFLLGAAEGGSYPGAVYYFSQRIPRSYRGRAYGWFGACGSVASVVSGPLSGYVLQTAGALLRWSDGSTYLRPPQPDAGQPFGTAVRSGRHLLILGDDVTTDYISSIGSIAVDSPAGVT